MLRPDVTDFGLPLTDPFDNRVAAFFGCYGFLLDNVELHSWDVQHLLHCSSILTAFNDLHRNEFLKFETG